MTRRKNKKGRRRNSTRLGQDEPFYTFSRASLATSSRFRGHDTGPLFVELLNRDPARGLDEEDRG